MLKKLSLHNFKSHRDTTVEFQPGLNVILGPNGAGKSSIFQAVGVALGADRVLKSYVRQSEKAAVVSLDFTLSGVDYTLIRNFGDEVSYHLLQNRSAIAAGSVAVGEMLGRLFGLDTGELDLPTMFNELIGVRQFQMVAPFALADSPRKLWFNKLFGTDEYDKIAGNLLEGERWGQRLIRDGELEQAGLKVQVEQYKRWLEQKQSLEAERESLKETHDSLCNVAAYWQDRLDVFQARAKAKQDAEKRQFELQHKISLLENDLSHARRVMDQAEEAMNEAQAAEAAIPALKEQMFTYVAREEERMLARERYSANLAIYRAQSEALLERRTLLETGNGACPACGQPLDDKDGLLLSIEAELLSLIEPAFDIPLALEKPDNYELLLGKARNVEKYTMAWKARIAEAEKIAEDIATVEAELAALVIPEFSPGDLAIAENEHLSVWQDKIRVETRLAQIEATLANAPDDPSSRLVEVETILAAHKCRLEKLGIIRQVYKRLGPLMANQLLCQINYMAASLFNDLLGEHYPVNVTIDADYGIVAQVAGSDVLFASLSGGQQVLLSLAIRLALLQTLSGTSMMLIDEPFDSLDGLSQEAVIRALSNLDLEQLIVITHNDAFDADHVIRLELIDGESKLL